MASDDLLSRNPTTGIAGCCARATAGHASEIAAEPPTSVMNLRRRMCPQKTHPAQQSLALMRLG
jgi:hypothetical protein